VPHPPRYTDPAQLAAIAEILRHPSYREADRDVEFLARNTTRGVRLQLDYSKAEALLEGHGIAHTIVVFGSTRIPEPAAAQRALAEAEAALAADPANPAAIRALAVTRRLADKSRYYDMARAFGRLVGQSQRQAQGGHIVVMTGGGPGIMEAANRGAHDLGCKTVGLNIVLPYEQTPNPFVTPDLCFLFHYFAIRKLHFVLRARALVVFPGGYGTLDELFEVLTLVQTGKLGPLPVILIGEAYWRGVFNPEFLAEEGVIGADDLALFHYAETAEQAWADIVEWYAARGRPLLRNQGA
jgi:uncharacterized protein (TIGR00730 family)